MTNSTVMNTAMTPSKENLGHAASADAATRGRLRIPARVVQRIAAQAASEVGAAGGRSGGLLGIGTHADLNARPEVEVDLSSDSVDLAIKVAMDYPVSLRGSSQRVRDHVRQRVERLTGIAVHRVDIDIVAVGVADATGGRQGGLQ